MNAGYYYGGALLHFRILVQYETGLATVDDIQHASAGVVLRECENQF